jgi:hypothetical protein
MHASFYDKIGVTAYPSNAAMLVELTDDIDLLMFGSSCALEHRAECPG